MPVRLGHVPQAFPILLPPASNLLVEPMLSTIGVAELMHTANAPGAETYRYLEPYSMVGFLFLIISIPTAAWLRKFEAWVSRSLGVVEREH